MSEQICVEGLHAFIFMSKRLADHHVYKPY